MYLSSLLLIDLLLGVVKHLSDETLVIPVLFPPTPIYKSFSRDFTQEKPKYFACFF